MKRLAIIAAALMLTLGLAQCKKEQPLTPETEAKIIHITVNVGGGSKHVVVPSEGTVTFADGDVLYVGNGSRYIGTLTCADGAFSGDIIEPTGENPQMHLYFAGGLTPSATPVEGTTENFTVNLSNQSSKLPVLSYTSVAYTGEHAYSCTLENKCALVKFSEESLTNESVTLTGVYNTATIDFANGAITPVATPGNITLYPDPDNQQFRWAILLPQTGVSATAMIGGCIYAIDGLPENITNNYYNGGNNSSAVSIDLWDPIFDPSTSPLTFEAKTNNVQITLKSATDMSDVSLEYAIIPNGSSAPVSWVDVPSSGCTVPLEHAGDKVSFRASDYFNDRINDLNFSSFEGDEFYVYGNIMSLIYSKEYIYSTATNLVGDDNYYDDSNSFAGLFKNNAGLYSHPEKALLLPATTLGYASYREMFKGCTHLTTAPELPATTLDDMCYRSMFEGCTALTSAPELPAESLGFDCYACMFKDCTALTTAPALPATSLQENCYQSMFEGCTNLVSVPARLPATSLARYCYESMFKGCTHLTTAPELPATSLDDNCYRSMFEGCTALTTAPELPATSLTKSRCYSNMFKGCSRLSSITCLATEIDNGYSPTEYWLDGVAATGTFNKSFYHWGTGGSGIPDGWTKNLLPSLASLSSDYVAEDGEELWGTLGGSYKISIAADATVTLNNVNITCLGNSNWAGITCENNANIVLKGTNTIIGGAGGNGNAGIHVPDARVEISGTGTLNATGSGTGAGIGGSYESICGYIIINSGTINAVGGPGCAGIGGVPQRYCDAIEIYGGTVTAQGGQYAAGIGGGGGERTWCNTVIIAGGTVEATGGDLAPGIGSGANNGEYWGIDGILIYNQNNVNVSVTSHKGSGAPYSIGPGQGSILKIGMEINGTNYDPNNLSSFTVDPYVYPTQNP